MTFTLEKTVDEIRQSFYRIRSRMTPTLKNTGFKRDGFLKIPGVELSEKGSSDLLTQFHSFSG